MAIPDTSLITPVRLALLIGCSYRKQDLPGTENDVNAMAKMLEGFGFIGNANVKTLCGLDATRDNILAELNTLVVRLSKLSKTIPNVPVVIYYSGHGASTTLKRNEKKGKSDRKIQFLVPSNFDEDPDVFRGILGSEISKILQEITEQTHNVTYILDCCHSARLGRAPPRVNANDEPATETWEKAWASDEKSEKNFQSDLITEHLKRLRKDGRLIENENWSNPLVVRIAAAAANETAWQYKNSQGLPVGIMTEKLILMISQASHKRNGEEVSRFELSWRTILLGVKAHVELQFTEYKEPQKPRSGGADNRIPFELATAESIALIAAPLGERYVLSGGRVHGVREGDTYILVPFTTENEVQRLTGTVKTVHGFKASLSGLPSNVSFQHALALPHSRKDPWKESVPRSLDEIHRQLEKSTSLSADESRQIGVQIRLINNKELALDGHGVRIGSGRLDNSSSIQDLLSTARTFSAAQELLSLEPGKSVDDEDLDVGIEFDIGLVIDEEKQRLAQHKNRCLDCEKLFFTAGDAYYIKLKNPNKARFFFSAFRVDAAGKILLINEAWETGIFMGPSDSHYALMVDQFEGITLQWPKSIARQGKVEEAFVFILTKREENLRSLETATSADYIDIQRKGRLEGKATVSTKNPYDVIRINYTLCWPKDEDSLESMMASMDPLIDLDSPPTEVPVFEKGVFGGISRWLRHTPPYVWVMNKHDEKITVETSPFTTRMLVTGGGVSASATGMSLNIESQQDRIPATKKEIAPGEVTRFPLWTRKEGFGFITIFVGNSETPCISNDQIAPGYQVNFTNKANLEFIRYNKGEV
ncbi:hypothetical protein FOBRF1_012083 [Fusarium oxysporum]